MRHLLPLLAVAGIFLCACDPSTSDDSSSSGTAADEGGGTVSGYAKADHGIAWNDTVSSYSAWKDGRDGQVYRTVRIGTQTWMAENLNYRPSGEDTGWCYDESPDSCTKYGRLYTWTAAMAGSGSSSASPSAVRGICPSGWHLPSLSEWDTLVAVVERNPHIGSGYGGRALKSRSGWNNYGSTVTGWDLYGFRALASGRNNRGTMLDIGKEGEWWTATESRASAAWTRSVSYGDPYVSRMTSDELNGASVRCLKD